MFKGKCGSKMVAFGLALVLLLLPLLPQEAQLSLAEQAKIDAEKDAKAFLKKEGSPHYFFALGCAAPVGGFFLSIALRKKEFSWPLFLAPTALLFGLSTISPPPPASRLLNMPTEYAESYLKQYKKTIRSQRFGKALTGSLCSMIIGAIVLGVILANMH